MRLMTGRAKIRSAIPRTETQKMRRQLLQDNRDGVIDIREAGPAER